MMYISKIKQLRLINLREINLGLDRVLFRGFDDLRVKQNCILNNNMADLQYQVHVY